MTERVVSSARKALVLTPEEGREIARLSAGTTPSVLFENGIPLHEDAEPRPRRGALFLGRLHPRKGATVFAAAAAELASRYPDGTFRIAGPDEGDLSNVRRTLSTFPGGKRVTIVGPVAPDQVSEHMRSAEVFVQPAADEPFGMTILEAMSVGTPPVVHHTSALAPLISAARAGWTFRTVDELRLRLAEALNSPQTTAETGARARQIAQERFSLSKVVEGLQDVYDAEA
nr:glycosyltransferase [Curtobacterium sp. YC1]